MKEMFIAYFEALSQHIPEDTEENCGTHVMIANL
jgi:hypothetical protein